MIERLVALLKNARCTQVFCNSDGEPVTTIDRHIVDFAEVNILAEYLIANGVIVPPCKVGDTLYRIAEDGESIIEERIGNVNVEFTIDNGIGIQGVWWLKDYNIGVTTFLTKEEAVKALEKALERSEEK